MFRVILELVVLELVRLLSVVLQRVGFPQDVQDLPSLVSFCLAHCLDLLEQHLDLVIFLFQVPLEVVPDSSLLVVHHLLNLVEVVVLSVLRTQINVCLLEVIDRF